MSLINKMLRDLDARGGDGARGDASSQVRPVSHGSRSGLSPLAIGAGLIALVVLGGGGFATWKYWRGAQQPVSASIPAAAQAPQAAPVTPVAQKNGPVAVAAGDEGPAVVAGNIPPEAHRAAGEKMAREMEERNAAARRAAGASGAMAAGGAVGSKPDASQRAPGDDTGRLGKAAPERRAAASKDGLAGRRDSAAASVARATRSASDGAKQARSPAGGDRADAGGAVSGAGNGAFGAAGAEAGLSPQQKAENEYRRALVKLQDARISEAMAGLERALELDPRHEAARQTLVSLLVESGRNAEAIHHLALATSLDPRQAGMAMLMARLQLENGGNALETLQRSLPYAETNAEYRAVMAGVLQRAGRHKEAVEHYQAAVRLQPANAVWWMGVGISLQAEKRNAEAKAAFQRAAESGRLAPELQSFVERRLQQLD